MSKNEFFVAAFALKVFPGSPVYRERKLRARCKTRVCGKCWTKVCNGIRLELRAGGRRKQFRNCWARVRRILPRLTLPFALSFWAKNHWFEVEGSSDILYKSSFSRYYNSFTFLGINVSYYYRFYHLSITDKSNEFIKNLLYESLLTICWWKYKLCKNVWL